MLHTAEFERFSKGEVALDCQGSCALPFALKRGEWRQLYDRGHWRALVQKVVSSGYGLDLTWFYLGRAAEALGYAQPARAYYARSIEAAAREATRCRGRWQDWCDGLAFPAAARERLDAMANDATRVVAE